MTEQKQRRKPRKYTDEFKQQLVELYRSGKRRCDTGHWNALIFSRHLTEPFKNLRKRRIL